LKKLRKLRVEALIFTGEMNKNYIGYSVDLDAVAVCRDGLKKLRKLRVEAVIFTGGMNKNYIK